MTTCISSQCEYAGEEEVHHAIGKAISNFFCSSIYYKSEIMMKSKILASLFALAFVGFTSTASAAVTINFDNVECPTCSGGPVATEWSSFGLTISNAYWYIDSRDTFDTKGLSIQTSPASISLATASADATIDYWVIGGFRGSYEAFDSAHSSLGVLAIDATGGSDILGTYTFTGAVSSIEWAGTTGFAQISTLTISPVPEPETYAMLLAGLGLLGFAARRRQQNA